MTLHKLTLTLVDKNWNECFEIINKIREATNDQKLGWRISQ